jgi:hypothetical protein
MLSVRPPNFNRIGTPMSAGKRHKSGNILLKDAMKKYVEAIGPSLSGTTVQGYSKEQYDSYAFLMEKKLKDITTEDLQKAVDDDTKRPSKRST